MSSTAVVVYERKTDPNGRRRYVRATKKYQQGNFFLRYRRNGKRVWEPAGKFLSGAHALAHERQAQMLREENLPTPEPKAKRFTLAEQQARFLEQKRLSRKQDGTRLDKETLTAYGQIVPDFLATAGKTFAEEVDGMDLRRYMDVLEQRGLAHRTICNYYTSLATFLNFCGIDHKTLLPREERPTPHDADPEAYSEDKVAKFLAACNSDRDRLFFEFLLKTGGREKEATHLEWSDITWNGLPTVYIHNKPELGFRTKTGKPRSIPLEQGLYKKLQVWRMMNQGRRFVFGTKADKPNGHFLDACKESAIRAGMNPEGFWLHKFRSTFATWALRRGVDIRTVQGWMGHTKIEMTERYLEKGSGEYAQAKMNAAFGPVVAAVAVA